MKRIALPALFFSAVVDFVLERGRIDLWLMSSSLVMLLWRGLHPLQHVHAWQKRSRYAESTTVLTLPRQSD